MYSKYLIEVYYILVSEQSHPDISLLRFPMADTHTPWLRVELEERLQWHTQLS